MNWENGLRNAGKSVIETRTFLPWATTASTAASSQAGSATPTTHPWSPPSIEKPRHKFASDSCESNYQTAFHLVLELGVGFTSADPVLRHLKMSPLVVVCQKREIIFVTTQHLKDFTCQKAGDPPRALLRVANLLDDPLDGGHAQPRLDYELLVRGSRILSNEVTDFGSVLLRDLGRTTPMGRVLASLAPVVGPAALLELLVPLPDVHPAHGGTAM